MALPAVGTRVRIRWQMDNGKDEWYDGDVTQARKSDFHVRYDVDGRNVKHDGKDRWQPLRPKPQRKTAAALDLSKGAGKGGSTITVEVDGELISMRKDYVDAVLHISQVRAARVRQRFVERCAPEQLRGRKAYFFRETDRHSMYYVRARTAMLRAMRQGAKKRPHGAAGDALEAAADLGALTQAEADKLYQGSKAGDQDAANSGAESL